ncbi:MAG: HAD family phosphatase [Acidobacteria bacterium]|nr:HAD family phosphatase [Acidobacteriota bacterium]
MTPGRSPFRLLALDIDGTLLRSDKAVSARTRTAIDFARAREVRVVLVTGRRHPAARRVAEQIGGRLPLVLHNGALVVEDGVVLRCRPMARRTALTAVQLGREAGEDPVVHCGHGGEGRLLVEGVHPSNTLLAYYLDKSHPDVTTVGDLGAALAEDPIQVMFGGGLGAMQALLPVLAGGLGGAARLERTVYPAHGVALIDVLHPDVGKAEALAFLQARWGIAAAETLAIGDNWNDRDMLESAGLGLVMGNADPAMRALGLPVLPTNDEDGVAVALERYVLQK